MLPAVDRIAAVRFLHTAFETDDAIGVLLKTYRTGQVLQRIVPVATAVGDRCQAWLRHMNAHGWNVYVTVNAYRPGRSRSRDAVAHVRHLFLEEDRDGPGLLAALSTRRDIPAPAYVLHSSPRRLHVLWRTKDIAPVLVERLQKQLARELGTDRAATSCAQSTRLPGLLNHKRHPPVRVEVEYLQWQQRVVVDDLPAIRSVECPSVARRHDASAGALRRASAFLKHLEPAIAGQRGDAHTFRVCCLVARGFDLSDEEALLALAEWNARCEPPWSECELRRKVANARRYGREAIGGRL